MIQLEEIAHIHIMAKRQGSKKGNRQLAARVATAAVLWHCAPGSKPTISYVANDVHGPEKKPDAHVVRRLLAERFRVPEDALHIRIKANCTLLEVRMVRTLSRVHGLGRIAALTHMYHAGRAQRYFNEVLPNVSVFPVVPELLNHASNRFGKPVFFHEALDIVRKAPPDRMDLAREHLVECTLNRIHTLDPRGLLERSLADRLRPAPDTHA